MFIPEYTITPKILKNIGICEYAKAVIENTPILPTWQKQLEKEARIRKIEGNLRMYGANVNTAMLKKYVDGLGGNPGREVMNLNEAFIGLNGAMISSEFEEKDLKKMHALVSKALLHDSKLGVYRSKKIETATDPQEILAEVVQLTDWCNSIEAKETHPLILTAVLYARLEKIVPFENTNTFVSNLIAYSVLNNSGYGINSYYCLEDRYNGSKYDYEQLLYSLDDLDQDFTGWIEFFTENLSAELSNIKAKILLLAKDTKIAKATGKIKLTPRQQRLVEYLQDYGVLFNKDFKIIFPDISEDSVLRDLKVLINMDIIQKAGSTKSSRYELF